jgi:hypothetical protein
MDADRDQMMPNEPHLPDEEKISYGDRFAHTVEMYGASSRNDEDARGSTAPIAVSPELPPPPEAMVRGEPIGSLPAISEAHPRQHVWEVLEDAQRHLAMIQAGMRDITAGFWKLARLPIEVAVMAARQMRPLRA